MEANNTAAMREALVKIRDGVIGEDKLMPAQIANLCDAALATPPPPRNCGECRKYMRHKELKGHGYCDNWAGVLLHDGDVCHPNFGIKIEETKAKGGVK